MDGQRIFVKGRTFESGSPELQTALAAIYETPERPRCLCVEGGVDLYISRRSSSYHLARMPGTGHQHRPTCPDYEPDPASSGRGALMGGAIVEKSPETLEIHIGFPLSRSPGGRAIPRGEHNPLKEVHAPKQRLSLQAVLHMLYETARFNRWYPAMEGARNQGVLCKYLMEAADHILIRGEPLSKRLYVPEPFSTEHKVEIAARRRERLAFLNASDDVNAFPFGFIVGEFKEAEKGALACKVRIKHMPDTPLYMDNKAWSRAERVYQPLFEATDADVPRKPRVLIAALIYAKQENVYQIERLTMMLVSDQYIPLNGAFELPLLDKLQSERRPFIKPLQYDSASAASFPNFLLLDAGTDKGGEIPLYIVSRFADEKDQAVKSKVIERDGEGAWIWNTGEVLGPLPAPSRRAAHAAQALETSAGCQACS
ncbi:MAG: DUF1173 family protein [Sterolibacteriaceae bacterium]|uniref:DUF1173 family protein n=1 Tax=Candidatus Methylophosphatis roskildensis TaxID=2899263 RepID=A0A9D7E3G2_9PROT|nr:DUF1173 family protein [Candidatus Methylophosphatis roskildensis]